MLVGGESLVELVDRLLDLLLHLLLGSTLGELGSVGEYESGEIDLTARLSADNRALCDSFDVAEIFLDLLGEYVLTVLEHDDGLESARNEAILVLVEISYVARSEPAVLGESIGGSFGVVVVTEHYVVALDLYLALYKALFVLVAVVNSYLTAGNGRTDRGVLTVEVGNYTGQGRTFGDTVALVYRNAERIEKFYHSGIESRAAADDLFKSAAEGVEYLGEEIASLVYADLKERSCRGDTELELLISAGLLSLSPDPLVEGVDVKGTRTRPVGLNI